MTPPASSAPRPLRSWAGDPSRGGVEGNSHFHDLFLLPATSGTSVQTDGENLVFGRGNLILLYRTNEDTLADFTDSPAGVSPAYRLNQGWIAFNKLSPTSRAQVWVRSPSGAASQISFYNENSRPLAVGQNLDVVFYTSAAATIPRITYSRPGVLARAVSSVAHEQIFWREGRFYMKLGRSLLSVADDRLALSVGANSVSHLTLKCPMGAETTVQVSSNLVGWTDLMRVTNETGQVQFDDPEPARHPHRHYRTKL